MSESRNKTMKRLYKEGYTFEKIAEEYGLAISTVCRIVRDKRQQTRREVEAREIKGLHDEIDTLKGQVRKLKGVIKRSGIRV